MAKGGEAGRGKGIPRKGGGARSARATLAHMMSKAEELEEKGPKGRCTPLVAMIPKTGTTREGESRPTGILF